MKRLGLLFVLTLATAMANAKATSSRHPNDAGSGGTGAFEIQGLRAKAIFDLMAKNGFDIGDASGYVQKSVSCKVTPLPDGTTPPSTYSCRFVDPTTYQGK